MSDLIQQVATGAAGIGVTLPVALAVLRSKFLSLEKEVDLRNTDRKEDIQDIKDSLEKAEAQFRRELDTLASSKASHEMVEQLNRRIEVLETHIDNGFTTIKAQLAALPGIIARGKNE